MDKWLYRISLILVVIGLAVSIYMTIYKVTSNDTMCLGSGDCSTVNASRYSEVYGIPVASVGVAGYFAILMVHWYERRLYTSKKQANNKLEYTLEQDDSDETQDSAFGLTTETSHIQSTEINSDEFFEKNGPMMAFGLALTGFLFTLYLIYIEAAILRAFCPFCITSQVAMTVIFVISIVRLVRQP